MPTTISTSIDAHRTYSFGEFTLDADRGALLSAGEDIKLRPKSFEVLSYLVERHGRLVTKNELLDAIWGQSIVTEDAVTHCLIDIRKAIRDRSQEKIRTVPRRGYIFDLPVKKHSGPVTASGAPSRNRFVTSWPGWRLAAALALMLGVAFVWWKSGDHGIKIPAVAEPLSIVAPHSIAVLPFVSRSANEEDTFFVDGLHDDLLTHIAKISSIKTISRTSVMQYRDTGKTIPQIAEELGVATIMQGGVQRAGDTIRINVQLIDAVTDEHLWVQSYDRQLTAGSIFTIQSEIASAVADALRATMTPAEKERIESVPTENLAALEAYFLGKQRLEKRDIVALAEAVDYFSEAIALDPDFALAYVRLADSYRRQMNYAGFPKDEMDAKGQAAIDKALQLDHRLGEAYASLANLRRGTNDPEGAEEAFKWALQLNPNYARAYQWYGAFLAWRGDRPADALVLSRKAVALDPLSAAINTDYAVALDLAGRFDEALAQNKKAIEIDPEFAEAYEHIGDLYWLAYGRLDEAIYWYEKSRSIEPNSPNTLAVMGLIFLELGDEQQADLWIRRSLKIQPSSFMASFAMEWLHRYRGEDAQATEYASRALAIFSEAWEMQAHVRNHEMKMGLFARARTRYEQSYPELLNVSEPRINLTNFAAAVGLALALSETGEEDGADYLLDRSLAFINTIPRLGLGGYSIYDVQIHAQRGNKKEALAALRQAIDRGWRFQWWYSLKLDLGLQSLHSEPEFQAMVTEVETDMTEQLARVHEWEANGQLAPIPKSME